MMEIKPLQDLLIFFISVFVMAFFVRRIIVNVFDPILFAIALVGGAILFLIHLFENNVISLFYFFLIMFLYTTFFLGILIGSYTFKISSADYTNFFVKLEQLIFTKYKSYKLYFHFFMLLFIAITLFFSYKLILKIIMGGSGAERLVIYKQYTLINIIRIFCEFFSSLFVIVLLKKTIQTQKIFRNLNKLRIPSSLIFYLLLAVSELLSGSKGTFFRFILLTLCIFVGYNRAILQPLKKYFKYILVAFFLTLLVVMLLYSKNIDNLSVLYFFIITFYERGDGYYFAFVNDNIREYYGKYNFILYHLHHFLRIFGLRGYELPVGSAMAADIRGIPYEEMRGGPNIHLPLLAIVLTSGNACLSFFYCFFSGILISFLRWWVVKIILNRKNKNLYTFDITLFFLFFYSFSILLDQNTFSYHFTSILVISLLITFIEVFLKYVIKKISLTHAHG